MTITEILLNHFVVEATVSWLFGSWLRRGRGNLGKYKNFLVASRTKLKQGAGNRLEHSVVEVKKKAAGVYDIKELKYYY